MDRVRWLLLLYHPASVLYDFLDFLATASLPEHFDEHCQQRRDDVSGSAHVNIPHSTLYSLHSTLYTTLYTLHYTLHSTLHSTLYTLPSTVYILGLLISPTNILFRFYLKIIFRLFYLDSFW